MKKVLSILLVLTLISIQFIGCGKNEETLSNEEDPKTENSSEVDAENEQMDPQSITGEITFLTNRTDIVNTVFEEQYLPRFNEIYPNIEVKFEAFTDYQEQVNIRMNTEQYGDVLLIPSTTSAKDLPDFFEPLGTVEELSETYRFVDEAAYDGISYGIPVQVNAHGIVYNKKVFEEAGVTEIPSSPEEFLEALQKIKDNTNAIPYYTNYYAGWPLGGQWEDNAPSVAGDPYWKNYQLPFDSAPWSEGKPYYITNKLLYDIVANGLCEDDPTTTDWESSKVMLNNGEIGCMLLGSWSIVQMQQAGEHPEDIGYMPFPYTNKDGNVYSNSGGDYKIGINIHSKNKDAAKAWLYWFINESGFALEQGGISPVKADPYPETLDAFNEMGVILLEGKAADESVQGLLDEVDNESGIGRYDQRYRMEIVESAMGNRDETFDEICARLNEAWSSAQKALGIDAK